MSTPSDIPLARLARTLYVSALDLGLPVHEANGIEYVLARRLTAWAGLGGEIAVRRVSGDNALLYGTSRLRLPQRPTVPALFVRADGIWAFLMRARPDHMRRKGRYADADRLFAKQVEWADMLHRYESHGLAVKPGQVAALRACLQAGTLEQGLPPIVPEGATMADALLALQIEWAHALHVYETCGLVAKPGPRNGLYELQQMLRIRHRVQDDLVERTALDLLIAEELGHHGLPADTLGDLVVPAHHEDLS